MLPAFKKAGEARSPGPRVLRGLLTRDAVKLHRKLMIKSFVNGKGESTLRTVATLEVRSRASRP